MFQTFKLKIFIFLSFSILSIPDIYANENQSTIGQEIITNFLLTNTEHRDKLKITLAVYDNNNSINVSDDVLRVYFSKAIDTATRSNISLNNYKLEGIGDLSESFGVYNILHQEDKIRGQHIELKPYESNLSIVENSISDTNGIYADKLSVKIISAYTIKKTGQRFSYDGNGSFVTGDTSKDDGYYQRGQIAHYTRDSINEIVLDHISGLMWADDSNVLSIQKRWVTYSNYENRKYKNTSGDTATTYCDNLTLGDYSDWRLPTAKELIYIVDKSQEKPSINKVFQYTALSNYWTSTHFLYSPAWTWVVNFMDGSDDASQKNTMHAVRCVRN